LFVIASVMASIVSAADHVAYVVRKKSRQATYSDSGALYPITLNQKSKRTLSAFASVAGQRQSVRKVLMNCARNSSRGVWQEPATLLAKPERATRQITMLTALGEPFRNVCSAAKRSQVPRRSSRSSAGMN